LLLEANDFGKPRLGEFLSPAIRARLNRLAILEPGWDRIHRPVNEFASAWDTSEINARNYILTHTAKD